MKKLLVSFVIFAATIGAANPVDNWKAQPNLPIEATDVVLADFKWRARPLIVFADSPLDPAFIEQMDLLAAEKEAVAERDILIITDTDPSAKSTLRTEFRPKGFAFVLVGKDGGVKLRKPFPWDMREISRTIDKMPMRQREIEDRRPDPKIAE